MNDCYSELAEIYIEQKRNEEAFTIIEKSHSRNTFQNLSDLKIHSSGISSEMLNEYYDLKWMIESGLFSGNKLGELKAKYAEIENEIKKHKAIPNTQQLISVYQRSSKILIIMKILSPCFW